MLVVATEEPASWTDLIGESVHTSDDEDIGDIEAVSRDFIVVKKGIVSVRRYYVPLGRVEGWDGRAVWLKVSEDEAKRNYERDAAPDPHSYHFSGAPTAEMSIRNFQINMPKIPPKYREERPFVTSAAPEEPRTFRCGLCDSVFRTGDELSSHVASSH